MGFSLKNALGMINPVAAIGTAGSIGMDYLSMEEAGREASRGRTHQDEINLANLAHAREMATRNESLQREFAQMGIRWRAEDAKAAGLHPLAALGASSAGASGSSPVQLFSGAAPDFSKSEFLSRTGQNISRAMEAVATREERVSRALQLERMQLENENLRLEVASRRAQTGPGMPSTKPFGSVIDGQPDSTSRDALAAEVWRSLGFRGPAPHQNRISQERGYRPDVSFSRTDTGVTPMVPESLSESLEDDVIGKLMWRFRNQVLPNFFPGRISKPPKEDLPPWATEWRWSRGMQEWQPIGRYRKK